jgi:hypothetical protein
VDLALGELPDDLAEWLLEGVDRSLLDGTPLDEALGIRRPVDPRTDRMLRNLRDDEIRRVAGMLEGCDTERAAELAGLVRHWWTAPDPRIRQLMSLGITVPGERQILRIIRGTNW